MGVPQLYWALMVRQTITWRTSLLLMIALTVPVVLYIPIMILIGVGVAVTYGIILPFLVTWDELCGMKEVFSETWRFTEKWWEFADEFERNHIHVMRNEVLAPGCMPTDVSFTALLVSLFLVLISLVLMVPAWSIIAICKFIPGTITIFYKALELWGQTRNLANWARCCLCPLFGLVIILLVPILCALFLVVTLLHPIGISLVMPIIYFHEESVLDTVWLMLLMVVEFDRRTTGLIAWEIGCSDCIRRWSVFEGCAGCVPPEDLRSIIEDLVVYRDHPSPAQQGF